MRRDRKRSTGSAATPASIPNTTTSVIARVIPERTIAPPRGAAARATRRVRGPGERIRYAHRMTPAAMNGRAASGTCA